jgi:hypothetical protein
MKTIVIFLLVFSCTAASAQKLMIGLHGGMQFNGNPMGLKHNWIKFDNLETPSSTVFGGRIGASLGKIQVGLGLDLTKLTLNNNVGSSWYNSTGTANVQTAYAFANLGKGVGPVRIFYGIHAGLVRFTNVKTKEYWGTAPFPSANNPGNIQGFCGGLQAGARVGLFKGLGIFAEVSGRYNTTGLGVYTYDSNGGSLGYFKSKGFLSFPVLAGIDYRL